MVCWLPDNCVMLPNLVKHLVEEAGTGGAEPLWIGRRGPKHMKGKDIWPFTMGGAGYCLDYAAAIELGRNNLADECMNAKQPDDMTIGLVMQRQKVVLHHSPQFHSQCKQPPPFAATCHGCTDSHEAGLRATGEIYNRHLEDTALWDTEQRHVRPCQFCASHRCS